MFTRSKKKIKLNRKAKTEYLGPEEGAYIIGDIHGCFDQIYHLLELIRDDIGQNLSVTGTTDSVKKPKIIFLGDLIDRGPRSKDVVDLLLNYRPDYAEPIFLKGNHEAVFLKVIKGDLESFKFWCQFGGRDCMRSYGVSNIGEIDYNPEAVLNRFIEAIEPSHIEFISSFDYYHVARDYLCVHAGIRPNVPLSKQKNKDMMWIREPFLKHKKAHEYRVIHGHTISDAPVERPNRIGIDTGVYNGNPLTCAFIRNEELRFIQSTAL